jgi:hypothetical protein
VIRGTETWRTSTLIRHPRHASLTWLASRQTRQIGPCLALVGPLISANSSPRQQQPVSRLWRQHSPQNLDIQLSGASQPNVQADKTIAARLSGVTYTTTPRTTTLRFINHA